MRTAASLTVKSEAMQAEVAQGGEVDAEQLVRISNSLSRVLARLVKRQPRDKPTLAQYVAAKTAARASAEASEPDEPGEAS